jgi:hypothetical protein
MQYQQGLARLDESVPVKHMAVLLVEEIVRTRGA